MTCVCHSFRFYDSCSYSYLFSLLCNVPLDSDLILLLEEVFRSFPVSAVLKTVLSNFSNVALGAFAKNFPEVKLLVPVCVYVTHVLSPS